MTQPTWTPEMAAELRGYFSDSYITGDLMTTLSALSESALAEIDRLKNENAELRANNKDNDENLEFLDEKMKTLAAELAHEREQAKVWRDAAKAERRSISYFCEQPENMYELLDQTYYFDAALAFDAASETPRSHIQRGPERRVSDFVDWNAAKKEWDISRPEVERRTSTDRRKETPHE